ncbi:MAG: NADH-quinone oxidoreductase subunit NuoE family protein [Candidatus Aminicenantales bacterium]
MRRGTTTSAVKTTGRSPERAFVRDIVRKYGRRRRAVIQVLQDLQDRFRWLAPETLEAVALEMKMPLAHVYSVATFYRSFSLKPRGRHTCTVCMGTACHVRGGAAVLEHFERKLGLRAGQTSPDGEVTLERVNCLGACALAPLAVLDGRYYGQMNESKADKVLQRLREDGSPSSAPEDRRGDEEAA